METDYRAEHARLSAEIDAWTIKLAELKAKAAQWHAADNAPTPSLWELEQADGFETIAFTFNRAMTALCITGDRLEFCAWLPDFARCATMNLNAWEAYYQQFLAARDYRAEREEAGALSRGQG